MIGQRIYEIVGIDQGGGWRGWEVCMFSVAFALAPIL